MKNGFSFLLILIALPFAGCGKAAPPPPALPASSQVATAEADGDSEYDEAPGLDEEGSREHGSRA